MEPIFTKPTAPDNYERIRKVNNLKQNFIDKTNKSYRVFTPQLKEKKHFSVATFNVHMWMDPFDNDGMSIGESRKSVDRILDAIRSLDADVLFLQEYAPCGFYYEPSR